MKRILVVLALSTAVPALAQTQQAPQPPAPKPVIETNVVEVKGTIEGLSPDTREVTVRVEGDGLRTFAVKPDVKRFNELKVGDRLSARYQESIVMEVRKAGAAAPKLAAGEQKRVPGKAQRPSGAIVQQEQATVEVKAIDKKTPSINVLTEDGRTVSYKVEHPERLEGLKVGDKIDITYTEALIVIVE